LPREKLDRGKRQASRVAPEHDWLKAIFDGAKHALVLLDEDGCILEINRAGTRIFGEAKGKLLGRQFSKIASLDPADFRKVLRSPGTTIPQNAMEVTVRDAQGKQIRLECCGSVVRRRGERCVLLTLRDVTGPGREVEKLASERDQLRTLIDAMPDHIFIKDAQSRFITTNECHLKTLGAHKAKDVIGKTDFDFFPRELAETYYADEQEVVRTGRPLVGREEVVIDASGARRWFLTTKVPLRGRDGSVVGVVGISRDITERKVFSDSLAESEARYRELADSITDVFFALDRNLRYTYWNKASEKLTGIGAQDVIGKSMMEVFPDTPETRRAQRVYREVLETGRSRSFVSKYTSGGREHFFEIGVYPSRRGLSVFARDITERKAAEAEIRRYSERLEQLVEERTRELRDAQRLATIGEVTAMVGHDLRNPLQAIVNSIYLAKRRTNSLIVADEALEDKKVLQDLLDAIGERVRYMNKIVSDLQDYARPIKLKPTETDMLQLVKGVIADTDIPGTITVTVSADDGFPNLKVDRYLMKRVLGNLVLNAVQAMPDGGRLSVMLRRKGDAAAIEVWDTGQGISEEDMKKLFTPLFTTKSRGQGFGLCVCKRFVEAHDGRIEVKSSPGKGTAVTVRLPLGQ